MSLSDTIAEALANSTPPPPNESTTCEWVIYPLLLAAGYAKRDIVSRLADNNGQFPDYALLSDTSNAWFLEAKAWHVGLQDSHAQQSLNYANQNGKRWVVLSNGREWRLYDNRIQGVAADKLVADSVLSSTVAFEEFMSAIGKGSAAGHGIEEFAKNAIRRRQACARVELLTKTLDEGLGDPGGEVIRSIWKSVKNKPGLDAITSGEVVSYFDSKLRSPLPSSPAVVNPTPAILSTEANVSSDNLFVEFWGQLLRRATDLGVMHHAKRSRSDDPWIGTGAGRSGLAFTYVAQKRTPPRVEFYMDTLDESLNKARFDYLNSRKTEIERAFGGPLSWERQDHARYSRVACRIDLGTLSDGKQKWPEIQDAMINAMDRLVKAIRPHVQALP